MKPVILSLLFAAFNTGVAAAASGASDDNSSIFIWIFFGMTGLIVAVLLVPALRLLLGYRKCRRYERNGGRKSTAQLI